MEDKLNNNIIVYVTTFGKKYHYNIKCQHIKGKEYFGIPLKEAKQKFDGACIRCTNKKNNYNSSLKKYNNNINLNIFQNNRNYNHFYHKNNIDNHPFPDSKNKNNNNMNQLNNNLNYDIFEYKRNKKSEDKKNSVSSINNKLSDFLSSSSSFTKILSNKNLFEEKSSDIDFNKMNKFPENNLSKKTHINNNSIIFNNIINKSEQDKRNSLSYFQNQKKYSKDVENGIKNNHKNNVEVINLINNYKNKSILFDSNETIKNNDSEINKGKNFDKNYISDSKKKNININISKKEQKNNTFYINNNSNNTYKSNINNYNKNNYISSSSSKINIINENYFEENDIIKTINETYKNATILSNINIEKTIEEISKNNNGSFIFCFKIIPKRQNLININIKFGYKFVYFEDKYYDNIPEEESSEISDDSIILSQTYTSNILYQLNLRKRTNYIDVLINFSKGKFFVIKNKEDFKINYNINISQKKYSILSISDCPKIPFENLKSIYPKFKYNPSDINIVDIIINGKPFIT